MLRTKQSEEFLKNSFLIKCDIGIKIHLLSGFMINDEYHLLSPGYTHLKKLKNIHISAFENTRNGKSFSSFRFITLCCLIFFFEI